jgi:hypothetical protein
MSKNIYLDDIVGTPQINLIYDNEIKGVFGTLSNNIQVPREDGSEWGSINGKPNIIYNQQRYDNYIYDYKFNTWQNDVGQGMTIRGSSADLNYIFQYPSFHFSFNYIEPVNIIVDGDISVKLVLDRYEIDTNNSLYLPAAENVNNFINQNRNNINISVPLNYELNLPNLPNINSIEDNIYFDIVNLKKTKFSIEFDTLPFNLTLNGTLAETLQNIAYTGYYYFGLKVKVLRPKYIEVKILGDTIQVIKQAFVYNS